MRVEPKVREAEKRVRRYVRETPLERSHCLSELGRHDAEVLLRGAECGEAEAWAREESERLGKVYVSPYNDPDVVGGQGTIALEVLRKLDRIDVVLASVGGGGLISGIGGYLKESGAATRVVGCLPEKSPAMYESVRAGRIVESRVEPTLSDATVSGAGSVEYYGEPSVFRRVIGVGRIKAMGTQKE